MIFINPKTLLCLVAVFAGTTAARCILVERDADVVDSGEYVVEVDSTIGGSEYEVETDSEIDLGGFTEGRRKRRKKKSRALLYRALHLP